MTRLVSVFIVAVLIILGINNADSETTPILSLAFVGGCYDDVNDVFIHCALIADECEQRSNIRFMRAHELSALGNYKCSSDNIPLGICENTGQCAITKDSCADPFYFSSPNGIYGECNAEGRFMNGDFIPTQYGACKANTGEMTCVLTPAECFDEEVWIPANDVEAEQNGGCRCHDVKIGVCTGSSSNSLMSSGCAMSVHDCHPLMQTFSTARSELDNPQLDCRLCPHDQFSVDEGVDKKSKDSADSNDKYEQQDELPENQKETLEEVEEKAIHRGEFVGLVVGLSAAFFIALVLFLWCCGEYEGYQDVHLRNDLPPVV